MPKRYYLPVIVVVAFAASLTAFAQSRGAQANAQPPDIVGKWSGAYTSGFSTGTFSLARVK